MTRYIWDVVSDNVLMEKDEAGATTAVYTQEPGQFGELISQRRNGQTSYYHYDGQGSTRALTDEIGAVTDTYTYSAFGEEVEKTGTTVNPYRYIGSRGYQYNEETGDYYVRARTYEPTIARWLSVDPLGFVDSTDRYVYVQNQPVDAFDLSGLACVLPPRPPHSCTQKAICRFVNLYSRKKPLVQQSDSQLHAPRDC